MRIVLFAAILLIVASVPAAYAATLQLVTENGNVFSIDFDEILSIWEGYNPSNQTLAIKALELRIDQLVNSTVTNSTSQQDVIDLQNQVTALIAQLNATRTNSTATDASVAIIQGQINALVGQLNTVLTNSTATEAEIDALQDQINTLTTEVENLEQDGIGAGALGTSGRMVSAALDGYVIYGEHGKLGTITEATTYNWYTGPVDYIGIIPDKDYFTKYSLDSPNGQYYVSDSKLVPVQGSSKLVRTDGHKVLEGSAPVIQDRGREVEIDVNGKVLVQLDESRLGSGVTIGVDTEGVTAQVVMSPNDLINTEYRDFNETGKFVLFEGEAQSEPRKLVSFGRNGPNAFPSWWICHHSPGGQYHNPCTVRSSNQGYIQTPIDSRPHTFTLHADNYTAIPNTLDVYVSNIEESLIHSNATVAVKYGIQTQYRVVSETTRYYDGDYIINSAFVNGLWHISSLAEQAAYRIDESFSRHSYSMYGWTQGFAGAKGTHTVADAAPYVLHGSIEPFSSESIPIVTNSNVYVLLEGIGKDQTYTVSDVVEDITPPVVSSIERHNPSGLVTNSDMLVYKVTFSEDVTGVDAGDFVLTPDSTSGMNVSLATYQGSPISFTSSRWTGSGSDTVTVTEDSTDMLAAIEFDFQRRSTSLSLRAPNGDVQSVPSGSNTAHLLDFGSGSVTGDWRLHARYNAHGSGTVTDWSLTVHTGNATSPVTAVSGSGSEYYVTVPASRAGTYGIGLGLDHHIIDTAGNLLYDRAPTSNVDRYSVAGITDVTAPVVSSIERSNPTAQNTNRQSLTYKVTFSEDVTGVDAFDFVFSPDSTGGENSGSHPVTSISGSGGTYHVTVPADTDGTYNLDLSPGHGIVDAASNPLTDTVSATGIDHTYVSIAGRDNTRPTVSSIDRHDPQNQYTDSKTLTYKVTFSEDVTGVDHSDFVLSSGSTGEALSTFLPSNQIVHRNSPDISRHSSGIMSDTITVSDFSPATSISVAVDITYFYIGNLKVDLIAPDGTIRTLHNRTGGHDDNIIGTYALDLDGVPIVGNWTLQVDKTGSYNTVRLNDWALVFNQGSPNHVASLSGSGDTYYATVFATQNGTYNLDLVPSGHGIVDTASNAMTDTSVAVGTARISANSIVGAGDVQINGLPGGVPWAFETIDGQQLHSGLTTPSGAITMPLPDYSMEGVTGEFSLLVYEDGFGQNVRPGGLVADLLNKKFFPHDIENTPQNVVYIPERYMLYPITVPVTIDDVRLGKLTTDCNVADQVRLSYLDGAYDVGSALYVPFIPGMSALKMSIEGASVCVKFADVLPPVQVVPFRGDEAVGRDASFIDIEANGRASTVLAGSDPTTLTVSFGASGVTEHGRRVLLVDAVARGPNGEEFTCAPHSVYHGGFSISPLGCPYPANQMLREMWYNRGMHDGAQDALENFSVRYEVTIDVFKNGQLYDTTALPVNSLTPLPSKSIYGNLDFTSVEMPTLLIVVPTTAVTENTIEGGGHYYERNSNQYRTGGQGTYHTPMGTAWSELFTHTFDITDGNAGDHIEIQVSNRVIFDFPYPYGHHHPYHIEEAHYEWPSTFETEILNGDDFLGPNYNQLEFTTIVEYGPNDRGVLVKINDGSLTLISTK